VGFCPCFWSADSLLIGGIYNLRSKSGLKWRSRAKRLSRSDFLRPARVNTHKIYGRPLLGPLNKKFNKYKGYRATKCYGENMVIYSGIMSIETAIYSGGHLQWYNVYRDGHLQWRPSTVAAIYSGGHLQWYDAYRDGHLQWRPSTVV